MKDLPLSAVAVRSAAAGSLVALGVMTALAARVIYTITAGHRWYQVRALRGK